MAPRIDFTEVLPVLEGLLGIRVGQPAPNTPVQGAANTGGLSLGGILRFYMQNKGYIDDIISFVRTRFFQHHPNTPIAPVPGPNPVPPAVMPPVPVEPAAPGAIPVPKLYTAGLRITSIRPGQHPFPGIFFIERDNRPTPHSDYMEICSGSQPLNSGGEHVGVRPDAVHLNFDTWGPSGKIEGADPDVQALLDYELLNDDGSFRVQVRVINQGSVDLTSDYDDRAMTPVLRVKPGLDLNTEYHVATSIVLEGTTRSGAFLSAAVDLSKLRIKPWAV